MQKQSGKRDAVRPTGPSSFNVVLILLAKVVIVQIKISIIEVREQSLQQLFLKFSLDQSKKKSLILVFQLGFHELLEHSIVRKKSKSWCRDRSMQCS